MIQRMSNKQGEKFIKKMKNKNKNGAHIFYFIL